MTKKGRLPKAQNLLQAEPEVIDQVSQTIGKRITRHLSIAINKINNMLSEYGLYLDVKVSIKQIPDLSPKDEDENTIDCNQDNIKEENN